MLGELRKFLDSLSVDAPGETELGDDELKVATAALLVHTATIDGHVAGAERNTLIDLLMRHFAVERGEAETLFAEGEARERDAVDIYSFTRVLQQRLSQEERQNIVRLMWEVVAADGEVHVYESNLVWRAAELIGVSTRDRVSMRQEVFRAAGIASGDEGQ